ncbi:hypothetical protein ACWGR4_47860 [Embleya sp. NPDC055664]
MGPQPALSLTYSSQAVDSRTAISNNQTGWVGDGWEPANNFIERRYKGCADDMGSGSAYTAKSGDLCWFSDNAVMSLNGTTTEHSARGPRTRTRPHASPAFTHLSDQDALFAVAQARHGPGGVLAALPCLHVNHPHAATAASYKPVGLAAALRVGLTAPPTLITSDPDAAGRSRSGTGRSPTRCCEPCTTATRTTGR